VYQNLSIIFFVIIKRDMCCVLRCASIMSYFVLLYIFFVQYVVIKALIQCEMLQRKMVGIRSFFSLWNIVKHAKLFQRTIEVLPRF
jgi:hypothetical protein